MTSLQRKAHTSISSETAKPATACYLTYDGPLFENLYRTWSILSGNSASRGDFKDLDDDSAIPPLPDGSSFWESSLMILWITKTKRIQKRRHPPINFLFKSCVKSSEKILHCSKLRALMLKKRARF